MDDRERFVAELPLGGCRRYHVVAAAAAFAVAQQLSSQVPLGEASSRATRWKIR